MISFRRAFVGSTPEGLLTASIIRMLREMKKSGEPICWRKVHGSGMQTRGDPDLDICYHGLCIKLEVKAGGNKPTSIQVHRIQEWANAGAIADVVDSVEAVRNILGWVSEIRGN